MKDLYNQLLEVNSESSVKAFTIIEKAIYGLCGDIYEGIGYYFIILKNGSLKVFPFTMLNTKYEFQESFNDTTGKLYHFLKVNRIHSICLKKEVDIKSLLDFMRCEGPRPNHVLTNVYSKDFEQAEKIFEIVLSILLYPFEQLNQMMRIITEYRQTKDDSIKATLQKMRGDWIILHNHLNSYIESLLSRYSQVTFVIRYPLSKSRNDEIVPEGFHIFFEKSELDLEYGELRKSEFFHKPLYIPRGERSDRLDSLVLKQGINVDDLFSFIYKIHGKNKLLFTLKTEYQPYLDKQQIPEQLESKFLHHSLPEDATVEVVQAGEKWNIRDATKVTKYIIERMENTLYVYQKIDDIPHIKINPIKIGVLDIEDEFAEFIVIHKKNDQLKNLVLRLKHHNNQLQELVIRLKEKNTQILQEMEEERKRKGGFEEIQQLQEQIIELKKEQRKEVHNRNEAVKQLSQGNAIDIDQNFLEKMAKDLDLSSADVLKLLSPDILEEVIRRQIQEKNNDAGMASLLIESQRMTPFIEKGLRDGHFSFQEIQHFFATTLDPLAKKEVARDFAKQLSTITPLPSIPNYRLTSYADYSPSPGGDVCLIYPYKYGQIVFLMLDLEGTGLEQSCNVFYIKVLFERLLGESESKTPDQFITRLQEEVSLLRKSNPDFHCFACCIGILNYIEHTLDYVRSALPYLFIYNRKTFQGKYLEELGTPRVGLNLETDYYATPVEHIEFKDGDIVFILTNGLLDCLDGYENFQAIIDYIPEKNIKEYLETKIQEAQGGQPIEDDIYLLAMEKLYD
ncbi:MAG: SpoIIE family protein phosphatase [Planctomycetes bacterium]|nr:SpoIIE family protein phosphatase [Planctomycetota bacterium]HPY75194.1 SpoIIE family protein phosphatase [Planctomycetota bacterium]HQB00865.1 SpoIIE family protein phosphatase [Planctomycetota bacterium]HRU51618.1 SpoIIE family protein phosphatase [Planctomycetota bacterium]